MVKEKIPNLFLHACTMSGHSFHFYISVEPLVKNLTEIIESNKKLASIIGADIKAASPTQIDRPPRSYNHKQPDGTYDYENSEKWQTVTLVNCAYKKGNLFKAYNLVSSDVIPSGGLFIYFLRSISVFWFISAVSFERSIPCESDFGKSCGRHSSAGTRHGFLVHFFQRIRAYG